MSSKEYQREWYERNKERHKANASARRKRHRQEMYTKIREYKESHPCTDCGVQYPYYVMQFDHLPGEEKTDVIGRLVNQCWSWTRILTEIAKCDVVCANCHATRTWTRLFSATGSAAD